MTLKARITKNSLAVTFLQQILSFKESLELILTDVAMTTLPPAAELCWDPAAEGLWWDCRPYQENRLKKMIEMKVRGKKYPQNFLLERKRMDVPNEVCNMRCHLWKEHRWRPVFPGRTHPAVMLKDNDGLRRFKYSLCEEEFCLPAFFNAGISSWGCNNPSCILGFSL